MDLDQPEYQLKEPNFSEKTSPILLVFITFFVAFCLFLIYQSAVYIFTSIKGSKITGMTFFEFVKESQLNADIILNADFFSYGAMWGGIISIIIYLLSARIFKIKMEHIFPMKIPALKHWMIWAGIMILFGLAGAFVNANTDLLKTDFMEKFAATMTNQTTALLGIGIFAPIAEELLFRGILYKGLKDALNGVAAVWIISVIFAGIHVPQYLNSDVNLANVGAMSMLLLSLSLILGFARHYSKSILIPIVLHILNNSLTVFFGSGA